MKRILFSFALIIGISVVVGGGMVLSNMLKLASGSVIWPLNYRNYALQDKPTSGLDEPSPSISPLPDRAPYTMDALIRKIPQLRNGQIYIGVMEGNIGFEKFTEIRRQKELSRCSSRQHFR